MKTGIQNLVSHEMSRALIITKEEDKAHARRLFNDCKFSKMPQWLVRILVIVAIFCGGFNDLVTYHINAENIYYRDDTRKLFFTLNTDTKEAALGTGDTGIDESALIYPDLGSPEWNTQYWKCWNDIEIPETIVCDGETYTVTSVAANAFYKCTYVQQISLPNTIRRIESNAFGYCVNMTDFNFPMNLESISSSAFTLCRELTKLNLPSKVKSIGAGAFHDCTGVTEVFIPASCTSISDEAFNWCTGIEKVIMEDGPEPLEMGYCWEKGISYEGQAGYCLRGMFGDAGSLDEVHWGRNLILSSHSNGYVYAPFSYTTNFYTNTTGAQMKATQRINKLTFGEYVTEIPRNAFANGSIRAQLILPPNLKKIADEAFNSTFLENTPVINFPAPLEYIGENALSGPNGVEFRIIVSEAATPPQTLWDEQKRTGYPFFHEDYRVKGLIISVPEGSGDSYRDDAFWGNFAIADPADELVTVNVKTPGSLYGRLLAQGAQLETTRRLKLLGQINEDDWTTVTQLKNLYELDLEDSDIEEISNNKVPSTVCRIKLPHNLKTLGEHALVCPIIGTLEIPATCTYIGSSAASATLIDELILPNNGLEIANYAFAIPTLKEVKLENVNITGDEVFHNSGLKKITLGEGCNITGTGVFECCYKLDTIIIDGTVTNIGTKTFQQYLNVENMHNYSVRNIIFNGCVQNSGEDLFFNPITYASYFHVNEYFPIWDLHIKDLDGYVNSSFSGVCSSPMNYAKEVDYNGSPLTDVSIPEGHTEIFDAMFRNCTSLTHVTLPSTIKKIGVAAFEGCPINNVVLPDSLKIIGHDAFKNCSHFGELIIPTDISEINPGSFNDCTSLKNVYAFYNDPIILTQTDSWHNNLPFNNVHPECCLNIPIGTASRYRAANWIFPNVQETGTLAITIEGNGQVQYGDSTISSGKSKFLFRPYVPFEISIIPDEGKTIKTVMLNGKDITESVVDNKLSFDDPDSDINLTVIFSDYYTIGDSNGDGYINIADAVNIANHIIGLPTTDFHFAASDVNEDGNITVSDITSTISLIMNQTYSSSAKKSVPTSSLPETGTLSCVNGCSFIVDGEENITALQFDINIDRDTEMPEISISETIADSHHLTFSLVNETIIRVILYSPTSALLPLDEPLFTVNSGLNNNEPYCHNIFASNIHGQSQSLTFNSNMSGLTNIDANKFEVIGMNKQILISNAAGQEISVYTTVGTCVARTNAFDYKTEINVGSGTYIVTVGSHTFKVIVK